MLSKNFILIHLNNFLNLVFLIKHFNLIRLLFLFMKIYSSLLSTFFLVEFHIQLKLLKIFFKLFINQFLVKLIFVHIYGLKCNFKRIGLRIRLNMFWLNIMFLNFLPAYIKWFGSFLKTAIKFWDNHGVKIWYFRLKLIANLLVDFCRVGLSFG